MVSGHMVSTHFSLLASVTTEVKSLNVPCVYGVIATCESMFFLCTVVVFLLVLSIFFSQVLSSVIVGRYQVIAPDKVDTHTHTWLSCCLRQGLSL